MLAHLVLLVDGHGPRGDGCARQPAREATAAGPASPASGLLPTEQRQAPPEFPRVAWQALVKGREEAGAVAADRASGIAQLLDGPSWLPNLQAKYGLLDGLEVQATAGYEPAIGLRALAATGGPVTVLGAGRVGYAYFRSEWLAEGSIPILWAPGPGRTARIEPSFTANQITGHHAAMEVAVGRLIAPGTSVVVSVAPTTAWQNKYGLARSPSGPSARSRRAGPSMRSAVSM